MIRVGKKIGLVFVLDILSYDYMIDVQLSAEGLNTPYLSLLCGACFPFFIGRTGEGLWHELVWPRQAYIGEDTNNHFVLYFCLLHCAVYGCISIKRF